MIGSAEDSVQAALQMQEERLSKIERLISGRYKELHDQQSVLSEQLRDLLLPSEPAQASCSSQSPDGSAPPALSDYQPEPDTCGHVTCGLTTKETLEVPEAWRCFKRHAASALASRDTSGREAKRRPRRGQEEAKRRPRGSQEEAKRRPRRGQEDAKRRPRGGQEEAKKRPRGSQEEAKRRPRRGQEEAKKRPRRGQEDAKRRPRGGQEEAKRRPRRDKEETKRRPRGGQEEAKRRPRRDQEEAKKKPRGGQEEAKRRPRGGQEEAKRRPRGGQEEAKRRFSTPRNGNRVCVTYCQCPLSLLTVMVDVHLVNITLPDPPGPTNSGIELPPSAESVSLSGVNDTVDCRRLGKDDQDGKVKFKTKWI
ncbi:hypothetical protein EYF80_057049 [Liparis tanakae]|uniref:Mucin-like domain-containing protein n=1 Tax=Liparis tanakae TaxID=230148 RepID=A0A4Z2EVC3_9TELE|nr:hypothetical protein EYF80_057049 [Liparis tanakae]